MKQTNPETGLRLVERCDYRNNWTVIAMKYLVVGDVFSLDGDHSVAYRVTALPMYSSEGIWSVDCSVIQLER